MTEAPERSFRDKAKFVCYMTLSELEVFNVRNIRHAQLFPSPEVNLVIGENASGKTALLEAIYLLGRGKSFRTRHTDQLVNFDASSLVVRGQSTSSAGSSRQLGVKVEGKNIEIRVSGKQSYSRSELAYAFPLQLILPNSHSLLEAGPQARREFMDWGVFHSHKEFLAAWRRYRRALAQRNVLLKSDDGSNLDVWEHEMAQYGTIVNNFRVQYLEKLAPLFTYIAERFLPFKSYQLRHVAGWDDSRLFETGLCRDRTKDRRVGFTQNGPHKADWRLQVDGKTARDYASRGQAKMLVIALKLAQIAVLQEETGLIGCILIDDLASEIDDTNRKKVFRYLRDLNSQTFLTGTESSYFQDFFSKSARFQLKSGHVVQG